MPHCNRGYLVKDGIAFVAQTAQRKGEGHVAMLRCVARMEMHLVIQVGFLLRKSWWTPCMAMFGALSNVGVSQPTSL